jgi:beta-glucosidase
MPFTHKRADFGEGFLFGAATAAYQIEGGHTEGRGSSIWDTFAATPGNVHNGDNGKYACDHYNRWGEDLDLLADGGFDAYRFSFAWPRILPEGKGQVNQRGLDFYDRLIDGMLERGLKPFGTLYHWDLPSALQDKGGWLNRDIAGWLADYAVLVTRRFGDRLASTATINEPWCVAFLSHMLGIHAPGYRDVRAAARASHHVLLAHGTAIDAMRSVGGKNLGIVLNFEIAQGASARPEDMAAARLWDGIFNRWYLDGIFRGKYPADVLAHFTPHMPDNFAGDMAKVATPIDWIGVNYYTRGLYEHDPDRAVFPIRKVDGPLEKTDIGWEIFPQGLEDILTRISADYTSLPIYVTENGMAEVEGADDPRRVAYYDSHLAAVLAAQRRGADVRGYFGWSLLDNYEWAEGYQKRFGMVHVDYQTQKRTPKTSYRAFQELLTGANRKVA